MTHTTKENWNCCCCSGREYQTDQLWWTSRVGLEHMVDLRLFSVTERFLAYWDSNCVRLRYDLKSWEVIACILSKRGYDKVRDDSI